MKSRSDSTLTIQGLDILEKLTRLLMEKELKELLSSSNAIPSLPRTTPGDEQVTQDPDESVRDQTPAAETPVEGDMFSYIEDPVMSQALFDFDQGMLQSHHLYPGANLTYMYSPLES